MVSAIDPTKPRDGVPAKKSELRANLLAAKNEIEELQIRKLENGMPFDMQGASLKRPVLENYAEKIATKVADQGDFVLDLTEGHIFELTLRSDLASFSLRNPPAGNAASAVLIVIQDESGGWSLAWPRTVRWSGGLAPIVTNTPNAIDIYTLLTTDAGASWFGFVGGQAFR